MKMQVVIEQNGILVRGTAFDPAATFGCGQCFRFEPAFDTYSLKNASGEEIKQVEQGH